MDGDPFFIFDRQADQKFSSAETRPQNCSNGIVSPLSFCHLFITFSYDLTPIRNELTPRSVIFASFQRSLKETYLVHFSK
ncbi:hypothetical protein RvY_01252 [Ramazzottius varieornatus]|uniref:Uncharacterized protein n=1 Tax=Ramazzottius varieornatus TaxID=947166 RepID=A0A1D1ULQ3_RAMVA|nr:hypothetical protein RvY_01252 [Ramazzottius varieornatus]